MSALTDPDWDSAAGRSVEVANRALLQDIYDKASQGDVAPLFAAMDADFVTYECASLPWGGEHRGLEANIRLVEKLGRYCDLSTLAMHHFAVDRDIVVAYGSLVWKGERGDQSLKIPLAEVYVVRGGKLISLRPFFWDTAGFVGKDR